jgi:signal transduction histidine kinase/CheY-like chemotaxis protein
LTPVAWAAVVKGMNDPVVVIDLSGRLVELNPAARRLARQAYPELLGADAVATFAHWSKLAEHLAEIKGRGEHSFEIAGPDPACPATFDAQISQLGEAGAPAGWVVVLRDITQQKQAGEERVRMLHEQSAREAAESANRAKDRFLATLSHELRTPLSPVLATVTAMLGDAATPDSFRSVLEMIRRNVVLEARLIDDLLDLARIDRGTLHLKREVIDAHEMVQHVIEICAADLKLARIELVADLAASCHHVDADPIRFQQILWNLIKNAIKFTPAGGRVAVCSRDLADGSDGEAPPRVLIEVSDTGIGIEPRSLSRIFDIMDQGGTAATRQYGGLGLGLTLSRSIAEQLDGRLSAASGGAGLGATFTLDMPTVAPSAPSPRGLPHPQADDPSPASQPRHVRILLVDDNQDTLKFLSALLTGRGHDVRSASDMASALRLASAAEFDLLISDIELPDGSGLELMKTIRSRGSVPGIALSGFGSLDDVEQSEAAGFALHLTKPVAFGMLEHAIQRWAAIAPAERLAAG